MPAAAQAADVPAIEPAVVTGSSATLTFSSGPGAAFECALDAGALEPCASPKAYAGLAEGPHTFRVRAIDADPLVAPSAEATRAFAIADATPPDTVIDAAPTPASPAFAFRSTEAGSTFECSVDGGAFTACGSPRTVPVGTHTFAVRAIDAAGNADPTPAAQSYTLDSTAPGTSIVTGPPSPGASPTVAFTFTSPDLAATFECSVDGGAFAACASGDPVGPLADGSHSFRVRARDTAGNADPTPATRAFVIDTAAPETVIRSGPEGTTDLAAPAFNFDSSESPSTFACSLDGGAFTACTSGDRVGPLPDGPHTFAVRAIDAAGNSDPSPATRTFAVAASAPDTTILSGPLGPVSQGTQTFTFSSPDGGVSFQCALDGGPFADCASPATYTGLADGAHTFAVRSRNAARTLDPDAASRAFTVDTRAPDTTITSGPSGTTDSPSPTFGFASTEPGGGFECRLDASAWERCGNPRAYAGLGDGPHSFAVRALDAAGNADGSEATRSFRVDRSAAAAVAGVRPDASPTGRRRVVPGPAVVISSRNRTVRASARGVIAFAIGPVRERVSGVVSLKTDGKVTVPGLSRRSVLALGSQLVRAAKGKRAVARVQLTERGRATLLRHRTLKLKATVTLRDAAGNSTTRVYRFTVRAG